MLERVTGWDWDLLSFGEIGGQNGRQRNRF